MANWRALTIADVRTRLSGNEIETYRNAALAPGEADPIQTLLDSITDRVRGAVARDPGNTLGASGTVPKALIDCALSILTMRVMTRCYGEVMDPTGQRKADAEAAELMLKDVMKGEGIMIAAPDTDDDPAGTVLRPAIDIEYGYTHCEEFTREQQDGF